MSCADPSVARQITAQNRFKGTVLACCLPGHDIAARCCMNTLKSGPGPERFFVMVAVNESHSPQVPMLHQAHFGRLPPFSAGANCRVMSGCRVEGSEKFRSQDDGAACAGRATATTHRLRPQELLRW